MKKYFRFVAIVAVLCMVWADADAAGKVVTPLEGTEWQLTKLQTKIIKASDPQKALVLVVKNEGENSSVSGFAGCNRFSGKAIMDAKNLWISDVAATKMACEEVSMEIENRYTELLSTVKTYKIRKNKLTLFDQTGTPILFFQIK